MFSKGETKMKNPDKSLFSLDDAKLNRQGLYEYALNIGENLGVKYIFVEGPNGEQWETSEFDPNENKVSIPSRFIDDNLSEREYRATKGAIDHETAHVLWPDPSYLLGNNKNDSNRELIWDIGNLIDDLRIEHRLVREYQVDANNFKYLKERLLTEQIDSSEERQYNLIGLLDLYLNIRYRKIDNSFLQGIMVGQDLLECLNDKITPIIDRFIDSDEKTKKTAQAIIKLLCDYSQ
jgi:hypothetical protein